VEWILFSRRPDATESTEASRYVDIPMRHVWAIADYSAPFVQDWLCEAHFFDQLHRDDRYAEQRLGFSAPNIFVMKLETYAN
jgi:hypothetical protein